MIDVLMLTGHDWANTGWRFSQCLQSLGLEVLFFKGMMHPFCYPEQGIVHPALYEMVKEHGAHTHLAFEVPKLKFYADNAKVIHYRDSSFIDTTADLSKKRVVVQHGGRTYRVGHETINEIFNPIVDATLIQMPDLLGLGAKNEQLVYYPVQTERLLPHYKRQYDRLTIGHFPTGQIEKGSSLIVSVLEELNAGKFKDRFYFMGTTDFTKARGKMLLWQDHLQRTAACDIIIETCSMTAQGRPYGEWGNTAIEAAALGKIVVTNSLSTELYKTEYGPDCALHIANNGEEMKDVLSRLLSMTDRELLAEKEKSRAWVEKYHSMEATAARLWDKIYKYFF